MHVSYYTFPLSKFHSLLKIYNILVAHYKHKRGSEGKNWSRQRHFVLTSVEHLRLALKEDKLGDKIPQYFSLSNTILFLTCRDDR